MRELVINWEWAVLRTLLVIATFAVFYQVRRGSVSRSGGGFGETTPLVSNVPSQQPHASVKVAESSPVNAPVKVVSVRVSGRAWYRNPFIPVDKPIDLTGSGKGESSGQKILTLQGIIRRGNARIAIISGSSLKRGGMKEGWRVLKIGEREVYLDRGGERIRLDLASPGGKWEEK